MQSASLIVAIISLVLSFCTAFYTYWRSRPRVSVYDGRWMVCERARVFDFTIVNNSSEMISIASMHYISPAKAAYAAERIAQPVFQRRLGDVSSTAFPIVLQPFEAKRVVALFSGENEIPETSETSKRFTFVTSKNATLSIQTGFEHAPYSDLAKGRQ